MNKDCININQVNGDNLKEIKLLVASVKKFDFNEISSILSLNGRNFYCGKVELKDGQSFYIKEGYKDIDKLFKENCCMYHRIVYWLFKRKIS